MPVSVDTALKTYRAKRRFDATAEPRGGGGSAPGALYLIQKHAARRLHYDFRLELDGVLLSWAVTRGPSYNTRDKRLAVRTEDHPLEYGGFEGTIPAGNYGAGTVMLWDTGSWAPVGDPHQGLRDGKLAFVLHGERLRGRWALVRMRPDAKAAKAKRENWLLIKESDEYANTDPDVLAAHDASAATGRTLQQIAEAGAVSRQDLPPFRPPMLATLVDEPPRGGDWIYEIKYDGYRALIAANQRDVTIYTRSGLDWTAKFAQIATAVAALRLDRVLLDGEITVVDAQGRTDFNALVAALESGKGALSCFVFDLLQANGKDLSSAPLSARKTALKKLLGTPGKTAPLQYSEDFPGVADGGKKLLATACAHGLEGLIAKRAVAAYRSGRHHDWLKIKCRHEQEFVIIGFSPSSRGRAFASILLAVNESSKLRYAGRVGTGFAEVDLAQLATLRDRNKISAPACEHIPQAMARGVTWVKPVLIAQVAFAGWTAETLIRHGRFKGLRHDKVPKDIIREQPQPVTIMAKPVKNNVEISHGERLVYPDAGISKADVASYLQRAAPFMLPYVKNRFVSFLRCPEGVDAKCFFQRHPIAGLGPLWISQDYVHKGQSDIYIYCKDPAALLQAVQMGVMEFHIWGSQIHRIERPDRIVFDLDPDETLPFDTVARAAFRLRDVLEALDLQSLPLLSGGKGIHVVVPIRPRHEWPVIKQFAGNLAARLAEDAPQTYVATMTKTKRKGKIFIDYFRNDITATAIAPYSPRARHGAAVAWPVTWAALHAVKAANTVSIHDADAALQAGQNGWADYPRINQHLTSAALKTLEVEE